MDDPVLLLRTDPEPAVFKHFQHGDIFWENLRNQFLESGVASKRSEMPHQRTADALPLVFIHDCESHLSCPRTHDDVTSATGDCAPAPFSYHCDQGNMVGKINIQEEVDFLSEKCRFRLKKRR